MKPILTITAVAALAACGHPAPAPVAPATTTTAPVAPADPVAATTPTEPGADADDAPPTATTEAADPATVGPTAPAIPTAPAASSTAAGCSFTAGAGTPSALGISILGLGEGGGGFDMPDICPQQACTAGLTVDLPNRGSWRAGTYDVAITTDGATLRCHVALAAPGPFHPPARCATEHELSYECARPDEPNLGPIMITGTPASVRIVIARDGATLADQTLHPSYSSKRWDGWDCDPSCRSAKGSVSVK